MPAALGRAGVCDCTDDSGYAPNTGPNERGLCVNRYIRDLQMLTGGAALFPVAVLVRLIFSPVQAEPGSLVLGLFLATLLALAIWFVVRGQSQEARDRMRAACRGGLLFGGVALAIGFIGPILSSPNSTSGCGPLVGICFTGPMGFVMGVVVGLFWDLIARKGATAARRVPGGWGGGQ